MLDFLTSYQDFIVNPDYELFVAITFVLGFAFNSIVSLILDNIAECFKRKYKSKLTKEIEKELGLNSNEEKGS